MAVTIESLGIDRLSVQERLELIEQIWDSLPASVEPQDVPEWHLAELIRRVTQDRETVVITRRGKPAVALIDAEDLAGLEETAYLLRSPRNAERLLRSLERALARTEEPRSIAELRAELERAEEA